jgi:PAS domain S-box-containing protein
MCIAGRIAAVVAVLSPDICEYMIMSHFILRWLNNIPSDDPIERQLAVLLQIALVGLILIIIGAIFLAIIAFESSPNAPAILRAIGLLITVGMVLMMMRRGHFKSGLWLVVGALLAIQLYGLYTGGLIDRGHALLSYVIPVSMAGLLIGRRALIIVMAVITAVLIITAVRDRAIALEAASIDALVALYFLVYGFFAILIEAFRSSFHQALANSAARAEELLKLSRRLEVTLTSIGDAVIVTDAQGQITLMNDVAQQLTGWTQEEAAGETLMTVFRIVNEETRLPVESPVDKVLREGTIVGLANHTILLAKDGREIPIDDSGAPIRNQKGNISGVVLVFRDIRLYRK